MTSELKEHIKPIATHLKVTQINILDDQSLFQNENTLMLEKDTQCRLEELARVNTLILSSFVLPCSLNF